MCLMHDVTIVCSKLQQLMQQSYATQVQQLMQQSSATELQQLMQQPQH